MECSKRRSQPRLASFSHVALTPSELPVVFPRVGVNAAYGVHGLASFGTGSSPRTATHMRSGPPAYTPPNDPHVQPSCEWRVSGSGFGQPSTTRYGPVGQSW